MSKGRGRVILRKASVGEVVDETLFGSKKPLQSAGRRAMTTGSTVRASSLHQLLPDAYHLTRDDLSSLQERSVVLTAEERARQRALEQKTLRDQRAVAEARKERMRQLEAESMKHVPSLPEELQALDAANPIMRRVRESEDEASDEVKTLRYRLNRMKYQKTLERQVKEKETQSVAEREYDAAWFDDMERRRIDEIQKYRQYLEARKKLREEDKLQIESQLADRELERIVERERVEAEGELMVERIRQDQVEAERLAREHEMQQRARAKELADWNASQNVYKERRLAEERTADKAIVDFQKMKALREQKLEKEKAAISAEKAREVARIQAQQKRMNDAQAEEDERRALSYQRALEKKERTAQEEKERRTRQVLADIARERAEQEAYKAEQARQEAELEAHEQERIHREQAIQRHRDMIEAEKKKAMNDYFGSEQKRQYSEVEQRKRDARAAERKEAEMEARARDMKILREKLLIERHLKEHVAAGYDAPPIRNGLAGEVLRGLPSK